MTSTDLCGMGRIEGVRMVELGYESRLLRMGCDSLLIPVCGSVGGGQAYIGAEWATMGTFC